MVPALRPRLERRRGQPAQSQRPQDRLPLAAGPHPPRAHRHHRKLRPDRGDAGREDGKEEAGADLAALPPARRGAEAVGRRVEEGNRPQVSDSALGRQRQVQLHRVAGPPVDRAGAGRWDAHRFGGRGDGSAGAGQADQGHHQAVRAGRRRRGTCRGLGPSPHPAPGRQADHHHHGAEVSAHPRRHRQRAPRAHVRPHHRRGPFESGRADLGVRVHGAGASRRGGRRRDHRRPDQSNHGEQEAADQRQLLRLHRDAQEQDPGNLRHPRLPTTASKASCPSTPTP